MEWFNVFGLVFMVLIMIPNVIFAFRKKAGFADQWENLIVEILEQTGRFGCIAFMIINIPGTWFGWRSNGAFAAYLIVNSLLVIVYCVLWAVLWDKQGLFKALALSVIPAAIFFFSGIMCRSLPLIAASLIFAPAHILISCKNAEQKK